MKKNLLYYRRFKTIPFEITNAINTPVALAITSNQSKERSVVK